MELTPWGWSFKMNGTVKWFNGKKGYGFIEGEDGTDYFVHYTAIEKDARLNDGDAVTFEPADGDRGKKADKVVKK
jgi:cold shock protein